MKRLPYLICIVGCFALNLLIRWVVYENAGMAPFGILLSLIITVFMFVCSVKRSRDIGMSGWFVLWLFVPIGNLFALLILMSAPSNMEKAEAVMPLKVMVYALTGVSALSILAMIVIICADVVLRHPWVGRPFIGAFDIVRIAGTVALAAALPYTTAVKGHVAIEYFFHKLNRTGRVVVDSLMRLLSMALFAFLSWRSILYGLELHRTNQVTQTLKLPIFWLPIFIGVCCFVVVLVVAHHLVYPRREMIKP